MTDAVKATVIPAALGDRLLLGPDGVGVDRRGRELGVTEPLHRPVRWSVDQRGTLTPTIK